MDFGLCVSEEDWCAWVDKTTDYAMNALIQLRVKLILSWNLCSHALIFLSIYIL